MAKLIGTDPNQVPTNADLGTMAYHDYDVTGPYLKAGRRNFITNGDAQIWQRNTTGSTGAGSRSYSSIDRFFNYNAGDTISRIDVSSQTIGGETGKFQYAMNVDGTQSSRIVGQCVEGPLPMGDYVLSAWVKFENEVPPALYMTSNNSALSVQNNFGGFYGGSGTGIDYQLPDNWAEVTQPDTWYRVYRRFRPHSPHLGIGIAFHPVWSSSVTHSFYLTGVQLELGPVMTPFEHPRASEELEFCRRYYEKIQQYGTNYNVVGSGVVRGTDSAIYFPITFSVQKRTAPSVISSAKFRALDGSSTSTNESIAEFFAAHPYGVRARIDGSGMSQGHGAWVEFDAAYSTNGSIEIRAEL